MGLQREEPLDHARGGELRLRQGGAPGRDVLLLRPRPRVRARLHQDLHLLPLSGQGLAERPRVGQAPGRRQGIDFTELANGFASCADPAALQAICDRFGPADIEGFFDRWTAVIPTPFTDADREAGYFWELSMRQVEVSPHPRLRRPPPGPGLLRVPRRRQHRHRPSRTRSTPSSAATAGAAPPHSRSPPGSSAQGPR